MVARSYALLALVALYGGCPEEASFDLRVETTNMTLNQGQSGTVPVYIDRFDDFDGPVTLTLEGAPSGVTWGFDASSTTANSSILWLSLDETVATGDHGLLVQGEAEGMIRTAEVPLTVMALSDPDFSLNVQETTVAAQAGSSVSQTLYIQWAGGFSKEVSLRCDGAPADIACTFDPAVVPVGQETATLTLDVAADMELGLYTILVEGTGGTQAKLTAFNLEVAEEAPCMALRLDSTNVTLSQGHSGTVAVVIDREPGFEGEVALTLSEVPTGLSWSFDASPTTAGSSILHLEVDAAATTGIHWPVVVGLSDLCERQAEVPLVILDGSAPDFNLDLTPTTVALEPGGTAALDVSVQWAGGFSDEVVLACAGSGDIRCDISPNPVPVGESAVLVTLEGSLTLEAGLHTMRIEGSGGSQNKTAAFNVAVE